MRITCSKCGKSGVIDDAKRPADATAIVCKCGNRIPLDAAEESPAVPSVSVSSGPRADQPAVSPAAAAAPSEPSLAAPHISKGESPGSRCDLCGGAFPADSLARFGDTLVCASCKPGYVQLLGQGTTPGSYEYGGFWIRVGAKMIDGIVVGIVIWVVNLLFFGSAATMLKGGAAGPDPSAAIGLLGLMMVIQMGIQFGYSIFFVGRYGATPGKMACGLKIVTPDGGTVSYWRATGRCFAEILSAIIFYIGYIMAAFDQEKRTLHDRICATRVVRK